MADETRTLFALDEVDARRVERLLVQRAAIETEISLIFTRASRAPAPVNVVVAPPESATFIIGGHTVGSVFVSEGNSCGVYDVGDLVCQEIPCSQFPGQSVLPPPGVSQP
jgi:hypothetical protein